MQEVIWSQVRIPPPHADVFATTEALLTAHGGDPRHPPAVAVLAYLLQCRTGIAEDEATELVTGMLLARCLSGSLLHEYEETDGNEHHH